MKSFISAILLALTPMTALASPNHASHMRLAQTIDNFVTLRINPAECWRLKNTYGYYWGVRELLVVCQQNARKPDVVTEWTREDYDTLRHEAHHLLQDCTVGTYGDAKTGLFFGEEREFWEFVNSVLTPEIIAKIQKTYDDRSYDDILMELEAFAVARSVSPDVLANAINSLCSD